MKNVSDGPVSKLDMNEKRISEIENMMTKIPQLKSKKKKDWNKEIEYLRAVGNFKIYNMHNRNTKRRAKKETEAMFEEIMT